MNSVTVRTVGSAVPPLGKADWIGAALRCLIADGVDAVQITKLAKALEVSRGSFYWHFADRQDLLDSVLDEWRAANLPVIESELSAATSLSEGVLFFFAIWENNPQFSAGLDHAIRDWARLDGDVLNIVRLEDGQRIATIARLFSRFGFEEAESQVRARVLYFAQVGYHAMNFGDSMGERLNMLDEYYHSFTGRMLDSDVADRFKANMVSRA